MASDFTDATDSTDSGGGSGEQYVTGGADFTRDTNYIATRITARRPRRLSGRAGPLPAGRRPGLPVGQPGDHRAAAARAWRTCISMGLCGPTHDERSWTFDLDPGGRRPGAGHRAAAGGVLRPRSPTTRAASPCRRSSTSRPARSSPTTSPQITLDLSTEWTRATTAPGAPDLYPRAAARRDRRGQRAGLHRRQQRRLPVRLRRLPGGVRRGVRPAVRPRWTGSTDRLADRRYLVGDTITEADVRLFTTLVRFDAVYHGHFKCNRQQADRDAGAVGATRGTCSRRPASATPSTSTRSSGTTTWCTPGHQPDRHRAGRPGPRRLARRRTAGSRWAAGRSATARRRGRRPGRARAGRSTPHWPPNGRGSG